MKRHHRNFSSFVYLFIEHFYTHRTKVIEVCVGEGRGLLSQCVFPGRHLWAVCLLLAEAHHVHNAQVPGRTGSGDLYLGSWNAHQAHPKEVTRTSSGTGYGQREAVLQEWKMVAVCVGEQMKCKCCVQGHSHFSVQHLDASLPHFLGRDWHC